MRRIACSTNTRTQRSAETRRTWRGFRLGVLGVVASLDTGIASKIVCKAEERYPDSKQSHSDSLASI